MLKHNCKNGSFVCQGMATSICAKMLIVQTMHNRSLKGKCRMSLLFTVSCLPIALLALVQPFHFASSVCLVAFSFPFDQILLNLQSDWLPFVVSFISAPFFELAAFIYT